MSTSARTMETRSLAALAACLVSGHAYLKALDAFLASENECDASACQLCADVNSILWQTKLALDVLEGESPAGLRTALENPASLPPVLPDYLQQLVPTRPASGPDTLVLRLLAALRGAVSAARAVRDVQGRGPVYPEAPDAGSIWEEVRPAAAALLHFLEGEVSLLETEMPPARQEEADALSKAVTLALGITEEDDADEPVAVVESADVEAAPV